MFIVAMAMVACGENNNNVNPNNNTNQEICDDHIDNDSDGRIDCYDSDCDGNNACATTPNCGDGLVDADEECDGTDLNGQSCESLGMGTGTLTCNECAYDTRGCSNNALKIYQSGTRMKMRVGTSPDGSKDFRGWYDSQLDINCVFRRLTTGQTRCIPELTSLNDRWYADANCTIPHAVFREEDQDLNYTSVLSMEVANGNFVVVQVVSKVNGVVYSKMGGECYRSTYPPSHLDVYSVSDHDASGYQLQTETIE